jgi:hypothetical protein
MRNPGNSWPPLAHSEFDNEKRAAHLKAANRAFTAERFQWPVVFVPNPIVWGPKVRDVKIITHWSTHFDSAYKVE